eukprot:scaffold649_cov347-Pavlova_lutheri.AAC.95
MSGFNAFLIALTVIVPFIMLGVCVYILINFQHPEDKNQAWGTKIIVLLGLLLAMFSVMMLPLDVGNTQSCPDDEPLSECDQTLPMETLWYVVLLLSAVMIFIVIPFNLFLYEADSDLTGWEKIRSASMYSIATLVVIGLIIGLAYGIAGYLQVSVDILQSGLTDVNQSLNVADISSCVLVDGSNEQLCDAESPSILTADLKTRASFPVYVIAVVSVVSWFLFSIFAGVGLVALPLDWIRAFIYRPKTVISRSEYVRRATELGERAAMLKERIVDLKRDQTKKSMMKTREVRKKTRALQKDIALLEEDERTLEESYPQGENPDYKWVAIVIMYILKLVGGILAAILSVVLIVHIILYMLISPPVSPVLNTVFIDLDSAFGLFGTLAFGIVSYYMILVTMKGNLKFGLRFLFGAVHPMRVGGTLMSSFLFNVALILLSTFAILQFSATAYSEYANNTAIFDIFTVETNNMQGIKELYTKNVFLYMLLSFIGLTSLYLVVKGRPGVKKKKNPYAM